MSRAEATPASSIAKASFPISALMRDVTKPGDSRTSTVSFFIARETSSATATVSSVVSNPRTSSINRMRWTGLKKCMPRKRAGRPLVAASSVMLSDDVFVARTASGARCRASFA